MQTLALPRYGFGLASGYQSFVVIDDSEFTLGYDVLTAERFPRLDPAHALTSEAADRIIKILQTPCSKTASEAAAAAAAAALAE